jgi:hypothetical protein
MQRAAGLAHDDAPGARLNKFDALLVQTSTSVDAVLIAEMLSLFEDAHWTDPTSLELFRRTVDRLRTLRILQIVTFRPEFDPPWIGRPYVTALTINRLAYNQSLALYNPAVASSARDALRPRQSRDGLVLSRIGLMGARSPATRRTSASHPFVVSTAVIASLILDQASSN